jgi:hypothetical protein
MEFYAYAEAFAALVKLEFVSITGTRLPFLDSRDRRRHDYDHAAEQVRDEKCCNHNARKNRRIMFKSYIRKV